MSPNKENKLATVPKPKYKIPSQSKHGAKSKEKIRIQIAISSCAVTAARIKKRAGQTLIPARESPESPENGRKKRSND